MERAIKINAPRAAPTANQGKPGELDIEGDPNEEVHGSINVALVALVMLLRTEEAQELLLMPHRLTTSVCEFDIAATGVEDTILNVVEDPDMLFVGEHACIVSKMVTSFNLVSLITSEEGEVSSIEPTKPTSGLHALAC